MIKKRLRVLLIAHEFSPTQGSECAEGWNVATRLAKYHNITVLFASGSQSNHGGYISAVKKYLSTIEPIYGLTLVNVDQPRVTKLISFTNKIFSKLGAIGLPILYYLGYKYWQKAAFTVAKKLHKQENFDVVHQLTQIAFREPGTWWKLNIPYFWGPTGGITTLPKEFYKLLSKKTKLLEHVRTFSNYSQFKFSSRVINANKTAAIIYAFSLEDAVILKKRAGGNVKLMLDAASTNHNGKFQNTTTKAEILRGVWCGQLIERKAATILLKALALDEITRNRVQFQIIGNGPLEKILHDEARNLGLNNIEWIQNVDRQTLFKLMGEADFFVHTSIREATSNVIPEALSTGLPVICHNANGMSIAINESCGIKIPFESPEKSIFGFHEAIKSLILNASFLGQLKKGAMARSLEISWDKMAETFANDYGEIVTRPLNNYLNKEHSVNYENTAN
jgi:glycosyltransferase involved in cell wall biosynthesis